MSGDFIPKPGLNLPNHTTFPGSNEGVGPNVESFSKNSCPGGGLIPPYLESNGGIPSVGPGVGGNGDASDFGSLEGLTPQEADNFLKGRGAQHKPGSSYDRYKFPDGSSVSIRHSDGRVTREPAPRYPSTGTHKQGVKGEKNINKGLRLNKDGSLLKTKDAAGNQIPHTHDTGENLKIN